MRNHMPEKIEPDDEKESIGSMLLQRTVSLLVASVLLGCLGLLLVLILRALRWSIQGSF